VVCTTATPARRSGPVSLQSLLPHRMDFALYRESGHLQASRGMLSDATRLLTSSPDARPAHSDAIFSPDEVFAKDNYLFVREQDSDSARKAQSQLLGEVPVPGATDQLLTNWAQKRHFPGRQGCQPKTKVPD